MADQLFEAAIVGSLLECNGDDLPPALSRVLRFAPHSFDDPRLGQIAASIRTFRETKKPVHPESIIKTLRFEGAAALINSLTGLPLALAEIEAGTVLKRFQARETAKILNEGISAVTASPDQLSSISTHLVTALGVLNGEVQTDSESLLNRLKSRRFSPDAEFLKPDPRFFLGSVTVCTAGNLTTISGQVKQGKSAAIGAMMASPFAKQDCDCLGFSSSNPNEFALLHIDSEQAPYDHSELVKRLSGRSQKPIPPWLQSYCLTGYQADDIRCAIPILMAQARKDFGGVHSLFIDGSADCVNDVNDPAESNSFVAELHGLAIKFDCPIVCVIHLNPGSEFKTRGHLGSQLERKAETNLKIEKDDDRSIIWSDKNRHAPILKHSAPRFAWSDSSSMHVSVQSIASSKDELKLATLKIEAQAVFDSVSKSHLRWAEFIEAYSKSCHLTPPTARRHLESMIHARILKKNLVGFYEMSDFD